MALAPQPDQPEVSRAARPGEEATLLRGRFRIVADEPLPHLDSPGRPAYNVVDLQGTSGSLFALICRTDHCPRIDTIPTLMRLTSLPIVTPVEAGVIFWAPANARRAVLIFEQPWGHRLVDDANGTIEPWREDRVIDALLAPLAPALREFNDRLITHRAIRPDNVFASGASGTELILGECVSTQPGYNQPAYVEPIESAMAQPSGRGDGAPADDIYALGVLVAFLLSGGNPVADMTDEEIIEAKIVRGSYAVLTGKVRASLQIVEILRGMLCDDPLERWSINELEVWLSGRHLSPKQPILPRKSQRAYVFEDGSYLTAQTLSFALARDWQAALPLARDGSIERWVRRSLGDDEIADNILEAMEMAQSESGGGNLDDILLSMILIALDPSSPVRYRDFSARPDGLHKAYAIDYADKVKREIYLEIVGTGVMSFWSQVQPKTRSDLAQIRRGMDAAKRLLQRAKNTFGTERVLYAVNPGWACQSPLFSHDYVSEPGEILPALDRLAEDGPQRIDHVDDHVIAFCAVTHRRMPESVVYGLAKSHDQQTRTVAVLQLLAEIQRYYGPPKLPALAVWGAEQAGPILDTFKNLRTREQLKIAMKKAIDSGNIVNVLDAVDNLKVRQKDDQGFQYARHRFATYAQQVDWIKVGGLSDPKFIHRVSRPVASVITAACSGFAILIMVINYVT